MHLLDNKTQLMLWRQHNTESMRDNAVSMSQDTLLVSQQARKGMQMSNIEAFQCYIIILATDAFMIYLDINVKEANESSLMSYFIYIFAVTASILATSW
jgi:hypothetical protein